MNRPISCILLILAAIVVPTAVATIDWERVPVPPMKGTPLPEDTAVTLAGREWDYGFSGEWDCHFDD